ncbi:MAG: two-component regulator propeller domain-containing protein [Ignavibacteriaceae bacterium]
MGKWYILLLILFFIKVQIIAQEYPFGHLSVEDGLSNNAVNCIHQDHFGFLWFGTEDGLNRYDGYDLIIYRHNPEDINSISNNSVWSIFEDHSGFLWIGTNSGEISRYDFKTDKFINWKIDSSSNKQNRITSIYEDRNSLLWIGTYKDGLYRYNILTNKLEHWQHQNNDKNSLSHNYITSILGDQAGDIWISTYNGLNKFNPGSVEKPFIRFFNDSKNSNSISSNLIWSLTQSKLDKNTIWISTVNGLSEYNLVTKTFTNIRLHNDNNIQFGNSTGPVSEELNGNEKILWIATYGGLVRLNMSDNSYERFVKTNQNPLEISGNHINYLIRDKSNVLWIATDNGLSFISHKKVKFNYSFQSPALKNSINKLKNKSIKAITQTSNRTLWLGTEQGLYFNNINGSGTSSGLSTSSNLKDLNVWTIAPGNSNDLWIGTYGQGIKQLDIKTGKLKSWLLEDTSSKFKNPSFNFVKSILTDREGKVWIGFWGPGLSRLNPQTGQFQNWLNDDNDPRSLSYNDVWIIFEDSKGRIWIGTNGGGLNLFKDIDGGKFYNWSKGKVPFSQIKPGNKVTHEITNSLNDNCIYSIYEAKRRKHSVNTKETVLWIGTGSGLNKFTLKDNPGISENIINAEDIEFEVKYFTTNEGLPDNSVKSILEDEEGNLWLGTNQGISFFNVDKGTFTNFTKFDGLNGNEFNYSSAYKTPDGLMLFGSTTGLNVFDPKRIQQSDFFPPVLLTDFRIFNKPVPINKESSLKTSIILTKAIILSHNQNVFSFKFSSLDYNSPQSNQYAYIMEGFDKEWIYSGSRQFVTYTNLDPGSYLFRVKATNSDGIWSKHEVSLKVLITSPWWKTGWAYTTYIFLIIAGLFTIMQFQKNRSRLRDELKISEFEAKKLQELENLKSRFFANLSHEFRTPLMLIKGPVEQLINKSSQKKSKEAEQLKMIQRNSQKLQELIDQLLELSQLEAASIPLKAKKENLSNVLKGIVFSFESLAKQKNINLIFNYPEEKICAWIDQDKFEKITNNLLSNACKFTKNGGTVSVNLINNHNHAEIKISDTGIGISGDQLEKIFDRFYQVDDSSRREFSGSGIGLALVKELIELHKWKISIQSEVNKGTEFTLLIPLTDEYLDETEKIYAIEVDKSLPQGKYQTREESYSNSGTEKTQSESARKPSLLIVEDSSDVRKYLSDLLNPYYNILESENGEIGLKTAINKMPDLIISDIMMPYMDGNEFCHRIKTNWETSHIPVILLTAKASSEDKIEGLEMGADDYLTKPFDSKELFIRVKNLLKQRARLKEKFSREIKITADNLTATSTDCEFLNKAFKIVEKKISDAEFDSEAFAKEMFVSRSQLHRKLMALTGCPPGEFVRSFRLKRAAQMILDNRLSITQIAFEVGFSSPSHFTKVFRKQFNCLPSEFNKNQKSV